MPIESYDEYVGLYREARVRAFKLSHGDIFSLDRKSYKALRIKEDKEHFQTMSPKFVWFKPNTWFPKYYNIMYIGENDYGKK